MLLLRLLKPEITLKKVHWLSFQSNKCSIVLTLLPTVIQVAHRDIKNLLICTLMRSQSCRLQTTLIFQQLKRLQSLHKRVSLIHQRVLLRQVDSLMLHLMTLLPCKQLWCKVQFQLLSIVLKLFLRTTNQVLSQMLMVVQTQIRIMQSLLLVITLKTLHFHTGSLETLGEPIGVNLGTQTFKCPWVTMDKEIVVLIGIHSCLIWILCSVKLKPLVWSQF